MLFKSYSFFTLLGIHILAGLVCAIAVIVTIVSRKRVGLHPICGRIYRWGLAVHVTSAGVLATANWTNDRVLLSLGFIGLVLTSGICLLTRPEAHSQFVESRSRISPKPNTVCR